MKTITVFGTLMKLAHKMAQAEIRYKQTLLTEDLELFEQAKLKHDNYHQLCLDADEMIIGIDLHVAS